MVPFLQSNVAAVVVALAAVAVLSLVTAVVALARASRLGRRFAWITGTSPSRTDTLTGLLEAVGDLRRDVDSLLARVAAQEEESRRHLKRVGLVRYDAFDGVAGQQSFSLCLLDDRDSGVLISSLVGSNFSRGYAVEIRDGQPARKLGDEERRAFEQARSDD